ncbi:hypothetical protein L596_026872 [Steinernema carpocapsae]|uniref:Major facilitator superfamily (MFS) profile domain-containing protein n=2 Tax=Steinernema carpocapsae TaxID=34508 RepID=A0A4U5M2M5_STECR|nr:hypothetical protein L596_026872 [Steinernema carpocapsae]
MAPMPTSMLSPVVRFVKNAKRPYFCNQTRFFVLFSALLCHTFLKSNTLVLNFTIICMNGNNTGGDEYSKTEETWLYSIVAVGSLVGSIPMVLNRTAGVRYTFVLFGLISAISTALSPLAVSTGYGMLLFMRFLAGFATAATYPVMGSITSNWSSLKQVGLYVIIQNSCVQFGPIFTMPVAGVLCTSRFGWESVFYVHGLCTFISFFLFFLFFRDSPQQHCCVSRRELETIWQHQQPAAIERQKVPYGDVFTSLPIIGVWVSYVGIAIGYNLFTQYGPVYLHNVLGYKILNTGFAGAFPFIVALVSKLVTGFFGDYATCVSHKVRIILISILSQSQMITCFALMAFLPKDYTLECFVAFCFAINANSMSAVATLKSGQLVASQHSHFVMAVINMIHAVTILVLPHVVNALAENNTHEQWSTIFLVCGSAIAICQLFFVLLAKGEPANWTRIGNSRVKHLASTSALDNAIEA